MTPGDDFRFGDMDGGSGGGDIVDTIIQLFIAVILILVLGYATLEMVTVILT